MGSVLNLESLIFTALPETTALLLTGCRLALETLITTRLEAEHLIGLDRDASTKRLVAVEGKKDDFFLYQHRGEGVDVGVGQIGQRNVSDQLENNNGFKSYQMICVWKDGWCSIVISLWCC